MLELIEHMVAASLVEKARPLQEDPRTIMQFGDRKVMPRRAGSAAIASATAPVINRLLALASG
jgi:hypothetical protein